MNDNNDWREAIVQTEVQKLSNDLKKAKRTGKFKLLASFGVGATVGTAATALISYQLIKFLMGGWLRSRFIGI